MAACWLDVLKVVLSPLATIAGAGAAVYITWRLGRSQIAIAQSQAKTAQAQKDIAFDKLKHDLFDKRYEVYTAAKGIMERIIRTGAERTIHDLDLTNMRVKMDEGRFFFPLETVALFDKIEALTLQHEVARSSWLMHNDDANRRRQGDVMGDAIGKLSEIHRQFPKLMQAEMEFSQLTAPRA